MNIIALFFVVTTEPGILPRAPEPRGKTMPAVVAVMVEGRPTNLRYCSTCHIYRSPKSAHCSVCDNCIENFDHHCSWVGTCVGRRNYRYFVIFVLLAFTLCVYVITTTFLFLWHRVERRWDDGDTRGWIDIALEQPGATAILLFAIVFVFSLGALLSFHCYLICIGKTTREQLKGLGRRQGNWCSNAQYHFCSPQQESRLKQLELDAVIDMEEGADWYSLFNEIRDDPMMITAETMAAQLDRRNQGLACPLLASPSWRVNASLQPPSPTQTSCCWSSSSDKAESVPMLHPGGRGYGSVGPRRPDYAANEDDNM